jgi:hypothetical protein
VNDDLNDDLHDGTSGPDADAMFAGLGHFTTGAIPVDAVLKQGRSIRARRRLAGGGVLAAAAALTIGLPVAIAGGSGDRDAAPAAGHTITVERPTEDSAKRVHFAGSLDGKKWSRTYRSHCGTAAHETDTECLYRIAGGDKSPVNALARDMDNKDGDFYVATFSPGTDYVVMKLVTGDQVVVPGVATDDGLVAAYFQLPRRTTVAQVFGYDKDGHEVAHTPPAHPGPNNLYYFDKWYRPDGGVYDISVPTVHVASGTADGQPWSIDVTLGVYSHCFATKATAADYAAQECPDPGVEVQKNDAHDGHPASAFVIGEVDPKTTRVDVAYKDGTVQHLIPVRSNGYAFVGTRVPQNVTVASITPVTGPNG